MNDPLKFSLSMNPYLFGCIVLTAIWLFTFWRVKRRHRMQDLRELWWASLSCCLLGISEPLFVPAYWNPPSVLQFYRWDFESFIFCFAVGGIAAVFWELPRVKKVFLWIDHVSWRIVRGIVIPVRRAILGEEDGMGVANITYSQVVIAKDQLQVQNLLLLTFFLAMLGATAQFGINIIYDSAIVCLATAGFIWVRRPKLRVQIISGGISFMLVYTLVLFIVGERYPDFFECWNEKALSGIFIGKAPFEEYLFAFTFGALWSPLYEAWRSERYAAVERVGD